MRFVWRILSHDLPDCAGSVALPHHPLATRLVPIEKIESLARSAGIDVLLGGCTL